MEAATGIGVGFLFLIFILIGITSTVFWILEIVDVSRREFRDPNNKVIWLLVIIFLHFLGALLYYFIGKSQGTLPGDRRYTQY